MAIKKTRPPKDYYGSEDDEQMAVIKYCDMKHYKVYHIPNEGERSVSYATKMQKMGLRKGVPDLCFPVARGCYHGMYIEMKRRKECYPCTSDEQKEWIASLKEEGYYAVVAYGFDEAKAFIDMYMAQKEKGRS